MKAEVEAHHADETRPPLRFQNGFSRSQIGRERLLYIYMLPGVEGRDCGFGVELGWHRDV